MSRAGEIMKLRGATAVDRLLNRH